MRRGRRRPRQPEASAGRVGPKSRWLGGLHGAAARSATQRRRWDTRAPCSAVCVDLQRTDGRDRRHVGAGGGGEADRRPEADAARQRGCSHRRISADEQRPAAAQQQARVPDERPWALAAQCAELLAGSMQTVRTQSAGCGTWVPRGAHLLAAARRHHAASSSARARARLRYRRGITIILMLTMQSKMPKHSFK